MTPKSSQSDHYGRPESVSALTDTIAKLEKLNVHFFVALARTDDDLPAYLHQLCKRGLVDQVVCAVEGVGKVVEFLDRALPLHSHCVIMDDTISRLGVRHGTGAHTIISGSQLRAVFAQAWDEMRRLGVNTWAPAFTSNNRHKEKVSWPFGRLMES